MPSCEGQQGVDYGLGWKWHSPFAPAPEHVGYERFAAALTGFGCHIVDFSLQ